MQDENIPKGYRISTAEEIAQSRATIVKNWKVLAHLAGMKDIYADAVADLIDNGERLGGLEHITDALRDDAASNVDRTMFKTKEHETPLRKAKNPAATDVEDTRPLIGLDALDPEFQEQQAKMMQATGKEVTSAEEYQECLTDLHIAKRSLPYIPGQTGQPSMWNQVVASAKMKRVARKSFLTGKGRRGGLITDETGLG